MKSIEEPNEIVEAVDEDIANAMVQAARYRALASLPLRRNDASTTAGQRRAAPRRLAFANDATVAAAMAEAMTEVVGDDNNSFLRIIEEAISIVEQTMSIAEQTKTTSRVKEGNNTSE